MNAQDRQAIDQVFSRLEAVERQAGPRDSEAEALIHERLRSQPGSAYYLAQTVVVQQQALENAQRRIQEMEQQGARAGSAPAAAAAAPSSSGFGRFGFGRSAGRDAAPAAPAPQQGSGFGRSAGGGGFLAGAAQTAVGVAGGMMLGGLLGSMFGGNTAEAAEPAPADPGATDAADAGEDPAAGGWDEGGMDDMDMGDF